MHKRNLLLYGVLMMLFAPVLQAQEDQRQQVKPQQVKEADVMYSKRTWRLIDLREKKNTIAAWPKNPVQKILYEAILAGKLRPYKTDSLQSFYDLESLLKLGTEKMPVKRFPDPNDDSYYVMDTVTTEFIPEERIQQLMIMEDWYFDKTRGTMRAQIIAIAPLFNLTVSGYNAGLVPLCWLRYYDRTDKENDCRDVLLNQIMFNAANSRSTFSYYDWFEQRNFESFVVKESNPYDVSIMDDPDVQKNGLNALIEAERRKQQTYRMDQDMYGE